MELNFSNNAIRFLEKIGLSTYGIYILHPIIYQYEKFLFNLIHFNNTTIIFIVVSITTVIISYISFKIVESKFIEIGKKIIKSSLEH